MSGTFYNTINVSGYELDQEIKKVKTQTERVYQILKQCDKPMTPFDVQKVYLLLYGSVPITSIRRAMTDLTEECKIVKTEEQKLGHYGSWNYCWKSIL